MLPCKLLMLFLVGLGATTAYVSPDDHGRSNTGYVNANTNNQRSKPKPLANLHAQQGAALRSQQAGNLQRHTRDVGYVASGSQSGSGGYSGSGYQQGGFGFAGAGLGGNNPFSFFPLPYQNNQGYAPVDFGALFNQLQQFQNNLQQNAFNQGLTRSSGIATRHGVFGPNGYISSSSNSFSGASNGGYGQGQQQYPGNQQGFQGASAVASLGPQGGFGSAQLSPDLGNRFGESGHLPPPNGGNVGVFTSSSSGSSNINGQQTGYKESTAVINDNGKITHFSVRDPPNK